jgi:N-acetylglutamate synthase-like GNAT family acetyltransferase
VIRKANVSDIGKITELHYLSQVSGILGKLSFHSLNTFFYSPLIGDQTILSTVETDKNGEIRGFLALRMNVSSVPFSLPHKNLILIKELLFQIIKSPQNIFLLFNALMTEKKVFWEIQKQNKDVAEIQILVVRKDAQGEGIGSELIEKVINERRDYKIIVKTQSIKAVEFYKKHGFADYMKSSILTSTIFVLQFEVETKDVN